MEAELKNLQDAIKAVGDAVTNMNKARVALHNAIETATINVGQQVAKDTASNPTGG